MLRKLRNFCRQKPAADKREHYTRGLAAYQQGQYAEAIESLRQLAGAGESMAQLGRYYEGMSHRALGIAALAAGDFAGAEGHLRAAAEQLGTSSELSSYLASLYAQTRRFALCADEMEKRPAQGDDRAADARKLAQAQWQAGRRQQAMLTLTEALRTVGPDAQIHFQLGLFHAANEEFVQAVECLSAAAQADCTSARTHHYLGLAAAAGGNLHLAIRSLQRALQLRPTDVMLAYQLAMAARTGEAEGYRVVVQLPENLVAQPSATLAQQLAGFVTHEKEFVEAFLSLPPSEVDGELFGTLAAIVQTAIVQNEDYADLRYLAAAVHRRLGQLDVAAAHARTALRINPKYIRAHLLLAEMLAAQERRGEALEHLLAAIDYGADWPDVHCRAGEILRGQNQVFQARRHFQRALELQSVVRAGRDGAVGAGGVTPGDLNQKSLRPLCLCGEKSLEENVSHLLELLGRGLGHGIGEYLDRYYWTPQTQSVPQLRSECDAHPDWPDLHLRLSLVLLRGGQWEQAAEGLQKALRKKPDYLAVRLAMAATCAELGQFPRALEQLKLANQTHPGNVPVLFSLGFCLERLSQPDKAAEYYRDVVAADGAFRPARERLAAIEVARGNDQAAIEQYQALRQDYPEESWIRSALAQPVFQGQTLLAGHRGVRDGHRDGAGELGPAG